ncbi:MAG: PAS domain S-box protein [Hyphomicrobiaceae bacterium]|nr:PAS domain S-box protein [Hyphomicrobiaceae bacterium]
MLQGPLRGTDAARQKIWDAARHVVPSGNEVTFADHEIIVSKTDLTGRITYANDVFLRIAGYQEWEVMGAPHSLIRHPAMPRAVFKLLWDELGRGNEVFAYVVNLARDGSHYWVYAHVTPSYDASGQVIGYHSNRRVPDRVLIKNVIEPLYKSVLDEEKKHKNGKQALAASSALLESVWKDKGLTYGDLILSL